MLEKLDVKEWLKFNAQLQAKKNNLRNLLKEKGILKREGNNTFDKYKYFSEAQYKQLFTELFSAAKLELSFTELEYTTFEGSEKQANGRMPKLEFKLTDVDTGFYESTVITGEGIDKGDKAGYKAYTGAIKYYLANTFLVATGDDPETESPEHTMNKKTKKTMTDTKATEEQINIIRKLAGEKGKVLDEEALTNLTMKSASQTIEYLNNLEVPKNEWNNNTGQ